MPELFNESRQFRLVGGSLDSQRVLWCDCKVGDPHKGIGPCGVNLDSLAVIAGESHRSALGTTDPIALHGHYLLGPISQRI